ncbi:MAG TPA: TIGR02710 family CRISPR-associated protein, partial [Methanosarcinales archaeon]|nr:TIGR02710 family CRISPR-associated protein [Methanosarcinales archaeon]
KILEAIIWSRKTIDTDFNEKSIEMISKKPKGHGYELVEDLLLNSERRASQGRYDDAVGRLYRALELLVQIRLKLQYGIKTDDVDVKKIPQEYREEYEPKNDMKDRKNKIGLKESYELLAKLNDDDPLAKIYLSRKSELIGLLEVRNLSIFAHGFRPITKEEYNIFNTFFENFFDDFFTGMNAKRYAERCQFPHRLQ